MTMVRWRKVKTARTAARPDPANSRTAHIVPFVVAGALSLAALGIAAASGTGIEEQAKLAARYTARASFAIFLIVYLASSLFRLWRDGGSIALVKRRRQWGLAFALSHTIHLAALAWYSITFQHAPRPTTLLGGGLGYALLYAMVLTSNDASQRAMGIWWKWLHTVGIHWLWFIFTFSYFGRIFGPPDMRVQGMILFPVCLAALALRIVAHRRT
ncbi:MAG: hypothetical protein V4530_06435 [Pseudomonadota bacterium]